MLSLHFSSIWSSPRTWIKTYLLTLFRLTWRPRIPRQSGGGNFYFHYITYKYNILYIFEKRLVMPFRIWKKCFFAKIKSKYFATHEKIWLSQKPCKLSKHCIKSSTFFFVFFFLWLQAFQKAITCFSSAI